MQSRLLLTLCALALPLAGQMSTDQRLLDFRVTASLYAKQYAPYEWKRDVGGFDMYRLVPWLDRVEKAKDDLEYYQILKEYVAALKDAHSYYLLPSTFYADLGLRTDIYDGKVLIDAINRSALPLRTFPFVEGDELVSIDAVPALELVDSWTRLDSYGSDRPTRRYFAGFVPFRPQDTIPRAPAVGDSASVVIRRQDGALETYDLPWQKYGRPLTLAGPVPSPFDRPGATSRRSGADPVVASAKSARAAASAAIQRPVAAADQSGPYVRRYFNQVRTFKVDRRGSVRGIGALTPWFGLPTGFQIRLGRSSADSFYSGVYTSGTLRIGFLRIPDFDPAAGDTSALRAFQTEIAYFQRNTDGLVLDVTHNPGGNGCLANDYLATLTTKRIDIFGEEMRPTLTWVNALDQAVVGATDSGAEEWELNLLKVIQHDLELAFSENRGRTGALGLCTLSLTQEPSLDRSGNLVGYSKPMLVLIDEFTTSAAEIFASGFQDNGFGPLMGFRTSGAGGALFIDPFPAGYYSEGGTTVTFSLLVRPKEITVPGYPPTRYIENVGVHPDIPFDVQTREGLLTRHKPFVDAFTAAIAARINQTPNP